jgi:hypothetical protein
MAGSATCLARSSSTLRREEERVLDLLAVRGLWGVVQVQDATCGGECLSLLIEERRRFRSQKSIIGVGFRFIFPSYWWSSFESFRLKKVLSADIKFVTMVVRRHVFEVD